MDLREQLKALVESGASAPYSLVGPDGAPVVLLDDSMLPFLLNPNPLPSNQSIDELFAMARSVRIREILNDRKILLEESDPDSVQALWASLRLKPEQIGVHWMTFGIYYLEVVTPDRVEELSIVSSTSIRWDERWHGDAELEDGRKLAGWLAERGLDELLHEFEQDELDASIFTKAYENWKSRMPCLSSLWPEFDLAIRRGQQDRWIAPALEILSRTFVTHCWTLRALLGWYGADYVPEDGTYQFEAFTANLLRAFPVEIYLESLAQADITEDEWAGAMRSFHDRVWGWRDSREQARRLGNLLLERAGEAEKKDLTSSLKRLKGG